MARKEFTYRAKTLAQLKELDLDEFFRLLPSRERRSARRLDDAHKRLYEKILLKENVRTHLRDMIVLPKMVGKTVRIHNGKEFVPITIIEEMIGRRFGEFALTRKLTKHSAPGVGATRSSQAISVR